MIFGCYISVDSYAFEFWEPWQDGWRPLEIDRSSVGRDLNFRLIIKPVSETIPMNNNGIDEYILFFEDF